MTKEERKALFNKWFSEASIDDKLNGLNDPKDPVEFLGEFFEGLSNDQDIELDDLETSTSRTIGEKLLSQWNSYKEESLSTNPDDYDESLFVPEEPEDENDEEDEESSTGGEA